VGKTPPKPPKEAEIWVHNKDNGRDVQMKVPISQLEDYRLKGWTEGQFHGTEDKVWLNKKQDDREIKIQVPKSASQIYLDNGWSEGEPVGAIPKEGSIKIYNPDTREKKTIKSGEEIPEGWKEGTPIGEKGLPMTANEARKRKLQVIEDMNKLKGTSTSDEIMIRALEKKQPQLAAQKRKELEMKKQAIKDMESASKEELQELDEIIYWDILDKGRKPPDWDDNTQGEFNEESLGEVFKKKHGYIPKRGQ
jgi:hypothetical protein